MEETKEISAELITVTKENALEIFTGLHGVEKIIAQIKAEVAKHTPDLTTVKGRKAVASLAAKDAEEKAKAEIEEAQLAAQLADERRIAAEHAAKVAQEKAVKEAEEKARFEAQVAESQRLAKEEFARREAEKQAAKKSHQRKINKEAVASFMAEGLSEENSQAIIVLIATGKIKNVTINY
jgi:hypothetical protein